MNDLSQMIMDTAKAHADSMRAGLAHGAAERERLQAKVLRLEATVREIMDEADDNADPEGGAWNHVGNLCRDVLGLNPTRADYEAGLLGPVGDKPARGDDPKSDLREDLGLPR